MYVVGKKPICLATKYKNRKRAEIKLFQVRTRKAIGFKSLRLQYEMSTPVSKM